MNKKIKQPKVKEVREEGVRSKLVEETKDSTPSTVLKNYD